MNRVLIVFAQAGEAAATLARLQAEPVEGERAQVWSEGEIPCYYRFERGSIAISSVGLHAAQMCVARYCHACDEVWNVGLAGALKNGHPIGSLLPIGTVGKYIPIPVEDLDNGTQECLTFTLPHLNLYSNNPGRLISSDFPIHDLAHRERLAGAWDLVDMEGYGIAYASSHLGKTCRMWKIISDFASPGGRELIRKHKAELSERIASFLEAEIQSLL